MGELFSGLSTLVVGFIAIGVVAIVIAVLKFLNIIAISRFTAVMLFLLAFIPLSVMLVRNPTQLTGRAGPPDVLARVDRVVVAPTQAIVSVITTDKAYISIHFGTSRMSLNKTVIEQNPSSSRTDHTVILPALAPRTHYYYQLLLNGTAYGEIFSFDTP